MGHSMRLELTREGLLVQLVNHYTTRSLKEMDATSQVLILNGILEVSLGAEDPKKSIPILVSHYEINLKLK